MITATAGPILDHIWWLEEQGLSEDEAMLRTAYEIDHHRFVPTGVFRGYGGSLVEELSH